MNSVAAHDDIDDLDLEDALSLLDLPPTPEKVLKAPPPPAPKPAPPVAAVAAPLPAPTPSRPPPPKEKPMTEKKCTKCGHPLRSDNSIGVCGDAAACRKRQAPQAPVAPPKPLVTLKSPPKPAPAAPQLAPAPFSGASPASLPPVEQLPMGYALAVHAYVSAAFQKVTTTK